MLPDLVVPMIPRGLCGLDGCVYTKGHTCDHSWMRPFDRPGQARLNASTTKFKEK